LIVTVSAIIKDPREFTAAGRYTIAVFVVRVPRIYRAVFANAIVLETSVHVRTVRTDSRVAAAARTQRHGHTDQRDGKCYKIFKYTYHYICRTVAVDKYYVRLPAVTVIAAFASAAVTVVAVAVVAHPPSPLIFYVFAARVTASYTHVK